MSGSTVAILSSPSSPPSPTVLRRRRLVDVPDDDGGGTWRVSLRLPESLRVGVESAARRDGVSVNAWLVRSAAAALGGGGRPSRGGDKTFSGWVR